MITGCKIKNILSISKLYTFFRRQFPEGFFFRGESHDFYEVVCVISGRVGITAGNRVFVLNEGEMTIHTPGEFHAIREEGESEPEVIIFSFSAVAFPTVSARIFTLSIELKEEIVKIYDSLPEIFDMGKVRILEVKPSQDVAAALAMKRTEMFLLSALSKKNAAQSAPEVKNTELFSSILSVMEENLSRKINLEFLAKQCGISVPTLEKTVYRYLGYGVMAHCNTLKMQHAHTLLLEGKSVKETASQLGFSNQNYFSARFKKHYGYPPSRVFEKT